jgi:hypothetical protein
MMVGLGCCCHGSHRLGASGGGWAEAAAVLLASVEVDDRGVGVALVVVVAAAMRGCGGGGGGLDLSSKYCRRREIMPTGGWTRSIADTIIVRFVSTLTTAHEVELNNKMDHQQNQSRRRRRRRNSPNHFL